MSTSPVVQIPSSAVDAVGLSITTATPSSSSPRLGSAYDLVTMAAATPIHFHPLKSQSMGGNSYLMINSSSWSAATGSASVTGGYTSYTTSSTPTWVTVNAATGQTSAVNGSTVIPAPADSILIGAASRGSDNLWLLHSVGEDAVIQTWFNHMQVGTVQKKGEETLPTATSGDDDIVFSSGVHWSSTTTPYLYVYGTGSSTTQVYAARKKWSRVGLLGTSNNPSDSIWEVYTGTGWSPDMTTAGAVSGAFGPLTSTGPLSFGHQTMNRVQRGMTAGVTGYTFMATTQGTTTMTSQIYSSLAGRLWQAVGLPITLGTVGSTYTGGTVQFQSHIGPNRSMVDSTHSQGAIPYLVTTKTTSGGSSSLNVAWSLLQVPKIA